MAYRVSAACERYVVRSGAQRLVAVSRSLAREIHESYGVASDRVVVISNGVDLREFSPAVGIVRKEMRRELGIPDDGIVVLFVGHNWERKGLRTLMTALRVVQQEVGASLQLYLLVAGGSVGPVLEGEVRRELGIEVRFLGTCRDMARIYGTSDVCVLPTIHEPFGLPVLEAMACGLPVIVSRCAGVAEVISEGSDGILLDNPADVQELAAKLGKLVSEGKLRNEIGGRAAETAKRYPWGAIAEKVERLYRETSDVE